MRLFIVLMLSSFYLSCSYRPISQAPSSFNSTNKQGLIAGSVSIINQSVNFNGLALYYRQIENSTKKQHRILITSEQFGLSLKPDYLINDTLVYQFIAEHPPGDYEFTNYEIVRGFWKLKSKKDYSIQFKIVEGQVSYLGDIILIPYKNDYDFLFEWQGNFERELNKFQSDFPNINWDSMKDRTPVKGVFNSKPEIEFRMEEY